MTAERDRRWRLTLGEDSAEPSEGVGLSADDQRMDEALAALYGGGGRPGDGSSTEPRTGGLGGSAPRVATWLGDIRTYFPSSVVQVMQRDAIDRLGVRALLLEPELMESLEPDVHLVSTLISLGSAIPETSKATARTVVRTVVDDVERRIANRTRAAVTGALNRAARTRRPKLRDIDWNRTIAKNLKNYLPEQRTVVPERLVGYGRRQQHVERDIILAIDQSGSMAASVVYASIFGAVIASLRAVRTSLVVFDTAVVDLTEELSDPVELLSSRRSSAAAPTSTVRSPTARVSSPARRTPSSFSSPTCSRAASATRCWRGSSSCATRVSSSWSCSRCRTRGRPRSTGPWPETSPSWESPPSRAPRTRSPTCSRSPWSAATSGPGRRSRSSTSAG